jgi:hypothetical protein
MLRSSSFSADDFSGMGQSDRELILRWLSQVENNLQSQIDNVSERVVALDTEQMRHLESHARAQSGRSDSPRQGEMIFKGPLGLSARGKAVWIAVCLLLAAVVGFAWRGFH